jgi:hypothetical protein
MMRIRVSYIVNVDDGYRRAILHHSGGLATKAGLATRAEVIEWCRQNGASQDDDLRSEHAQCCWGEEKEDE